MNKKIQLFIKIIITFFGFGLIIFLLREKLDEVYLIIKQCNIYIFIIALLLYVGVTILSALRFKIILSMQGIVLPILKTWKIYFLGLFFNLFLPSSVGGDIVKGYYISTFCLNKSRSYISVIIDRIVGIFSLVFLCSLSTIRFTSLNYI